MKERDAEGVEDVRGYYRKILPFYEKESVDRAHLSFWSGLARRWKPRRILEIGAGLGQITAAMSRRAPAVGIDLSLEMLSEAARRRSGARARFVAADMREVNFGRAFDLIVAPGDPFSHLTKLSDRRLALRAVARQLAPGGRFVVEGLYRRRRDFLLPARRIRHAAGVLHIEESWIPVGLRDLWHARYRYCDRSRNGAEETLSATFVARAWDPKGIRSLFASCGLRVEALWGGFDERAFKREAGRVVILASASSSSSSSSSAGPRRSNS